MYTPTLHLHMTIVIFQSVFYFDSCGCIVRGRLVLGYIGLAAGSRGNNGVPQSRALTSALKCGAETLAHNYNEPPITLKTSHQCTTRTSALRNLTATAECVFF